MIKTRLTQKVKKPNFSEEVKRLTLIQTLKKTNLSRVNNNVIITVICDLPVQPLLGMPAESGGGNEVKYLCRISAIKTSQGCNRWFIPGHFPVMFGEKTTNLLTLWKFYCSWWWLLRFVWSQKETRWKDRGNDCRNNQSFHCCDSDGDFCWENWMQHTTVFTMSPQQLSIISGKHHLDLF